MKQDITKRLEDLEKRVKKLETRKKQTCKTVVINGGRSPGSCAHGAFSPSNCGMCAYGKKPRWKPEW